MSAPSRISSSPGTNRPSDPNVPRQLCITTWYPRDANRPRRMCGTDPRPLVGAAHHDGAESRAVRGVVVGEQVHTVAHPDPDGRRHRVGPALRRQVEQPRRGRVDQTLGPAPRAGSHIGSDRWPLLCSRSRPLSPGRVCHRRSLAPSGGRAPHRQGHPGPQARRSTATSSAPNGDLGAGRYEASRRAPRRRTGPDPVRAERERPVLAGEPGEVGHGRRRRGDHDAGERDRPVRAGRDPEMTGRIPASTCPALC